MAEVHTYASIPVFIDAIEWNGSSEEATTVINWVLENGGTARYDSAHINPQGNPVEASLHIDTLEGTMIASAGDFIIRGLIGEFYPCKPEVFHRKYER